jgi:hypothetical protein
LEKKMKKLSNLLWLVIVFALLSTPLHLRAQTVTPPTPTPNLFSISGNIADFGRGATPQAAMIATASVQTTKNLSLGYEHIAVSGGNARWELGVGAYTRPLSDLLGSKLTSKLLINTSIIGVTFSAGAGKVLLPTANRIAETAGVHISYPLIDGISLQLIGVDVLHGAGHTSFLTVNTTTAISTGINIYFGHR